MQQAAGIAKSWRTNRQNAYEAYLEDRADYAEAKAKAEASGAPLDPKRKEPEWRAWKIFLSCVFPQSRPMPTW